MNTSFVAIEDNAFNNIQEIKEAMINQKNIYEENIKNLEVILENLCNKFFAL